MRTGEAIRTRMAKAIEDIVLRELRTDGIVIGPPDAHSRRLQKLLVDTCLAPILTWSELVEERGCLGRLQKQRLCIKDRLHYRVKVSSQSASTEALGTVVDSLDRLQ